MPLMSGASGGVSLSDEAAVKTRLLFDGDGTGEERRLNVLYKSVVKWCSQSEGGVAGDEEGPSSHDVKRHAQLVAQLLHIEWTDAKSKLVQEMNEREAKNYDNLLGVIQAKLEEAESDIAEAKTELEAARLVRRNRMEYDSMAKSIAAYPSRADSGMNIEQASDHLKRLKQEEEEMDAKLQQRKKQFHVLVNSIHQLQDLLVQEEAEELRLAGDQGSQADLNNTKSSSSQYTASENGCCTPCSANHTSELNTSNVSSAGVADRGPPEVEIMETN